MSLNVTGGALLRGAQNRDVKQMWKDENRMFVMVVGIAKTSHFIFLIFIHLVLDLSVLFGPSPESDFLRHL